MYIRFLKSLIIHKWYVLLAGLKLGVPLWRLIIHDWQKFTRAEFGPYARYFQDGKQAKDAPAFALAWLHHVHRGPHHWEYWKLNEDYNLSIAINGTFPMPEIYVREMVADWMGASMAYTKSWDMTSWLATNLPRMKMHPGTVDILTDVLGELEYECTT